MTEPINFNSYGDADEVTREMEAILCGHRIVKAEQPSGMNCPDARLTLDDGTVLDVVGNEGCGGCSYGNYMLTTLNDCDNIITSVTADIIDSDDKNEYNEEEETFSIFVFTVDQKIHALGFTGSDNGYYGMGFTITVKRPA